MSNIITSKTRYYCDTKPPVGSQVNWGNPLSKGLVGCWLLNEGGGGIAINLANTKSLAAGVAAGRSLTREGLKFTASTNIFAVGSAVNLSLPFTIIIAMTKKIAVGTSSAFLLVGKHGSSTNYSKLDWFFTSTAPAHSNLRYAYYSGSEQRIDISNQYGINTPFDTCGCTYDGTNMTGFLNGVRELTAAGTPTNPAANVRIGLWFGGAGCILTTYKYTYIWQRVLSDNEIRQLYIQPYQFIQPIKKRYVFDLGGEAPTANITGIMTPRSGYWGDL